MNSFNSDNFNKQTLSELLVLHGWSGGTIHEAVKGIKIVNRPRRLENTFTLKFDKEEVFINKNKVAMYLTADKELNGYSAAKFLSNHLTSFLLDNLENMQDLR